MKLEEDDVLLRFGGGLTGCSSSESSVKSIVSACLRLLGVGALVDEFVCAGGVARRFGAVTNSLVELRLGSDISIRSSSLSSSSSSSLSSLSCLKPLLDRCESSMCQVPSGSTVTWSTDAGTLRKMSSKYWSKTS